VGRRGGIVDLTPTRGVPGWPQGGYLVHVANFAPGWRAKVDGRGAFISRVPTPSSAIPLDRRGTSSRAAHKPLSVALGIQLTILAACMGAAALPQLLAHRWSRIRPLPVRWAWPTLTRPHGRCWGDACLVAV
jgi:hypothetical protein